MFGKTKLSLGALVALASAQSAPGFPISASQQLTVAFGNNTVSPPGELIPRGGTYSNPLILLVSGLCSSADAQPRR
jgi:hypothetical protein